MRSILMLGVLACVPLDDTEVEHETMTPEARVAEHRALLLSFFKDQASGVHLNWEDYAPRFMRLAERNPEDFVGFDSLCFFIVHDGAGQPEFPRAMDLLIQHHAHGERVVDLIRFLVSPAYFASASGSVERLLREVIDRNPSRDVRAEACFCLVQFLKNKAEFVSLLKSPQGDELAEGLEDRWGRDYVEQIKSCDPGRLTEEADELFEQGHEKYADYLDSHVVYGEQAPEINGDDIHGRPMRMSDYRGKVVVLDFWGDW